MSDLLAEANRLVGPKLKWCICPDCNSASLIPSAHEWWICAGCNETQVVDNLPLPPAILCSGCGEPLDRYVGYFSCNPCGRTVTACN